MNVPALRQSRDGQMTNDLAIITTMENPTVLNSEDFIKAIRKTLEEML